MLNTFIIYVGLYFPVAGIISALQSECKKHQNEEYYKQDSIKTDLLFFDQQVETTIGAVIMLSQNITPAFRTDPGELVIIIHQKFPLSYKFVFLLQ